jgi:hypothetical protein
MGEWWKRPCTIGSTSTCSPSGVAPLAAAIAALER